MVLKHYITSITRGGKSFERFGQRSTKAIGTLKALLAMQYDEHLTVAESIIISMHGCELTKCSARLVNLAVESGQRIDCRQARNGVSVLDVVLSMEKYLNGPKHYLVNMNLYMVCRLQLQMLELENQLVARRREQAHFYAIVDSGQASKESS